MAAPKALLSSESNEWYTPEHPYLDAVREVFGGGIELDPASCQYANNNFVHADRIYTIDDDGLDQPWDRANGEMTESVFVNPPYGRHYVTFGLFNSDLWTEKCFEEYDAGRIRQAIILVNASVGDQWFNKFWGLPICFCYKRIHFLNETGKKKQPTKGNVFVYLPDRDDIVRSSARFAHGFRFIGYTFWHEADKQLPREVANSETFDIPDFPDIPRSDMRLFKQLPREVAIGSGGAISDQDWTHKVSGVYGERREPSYDGVDTASVTEHSQGI